jgi:hypothetical protein
MISNASSPTGVLLHVQQEGLAAGNLLATMLQAA